MRLYCNDWLYCTVVALLAGGAGAAVLYCTRTASWGSRCGCIELYSHSYLGELVRLYFTVLAQLAGRVGAANFTVLAQLAGGAGAAVHYCTTVLDYTRIASWGKKSGCTVL